MYTKLRTKEFLIIVLGLGILGLIYISWTKCTEKPKLPGSQNNLPIIYAITPTYYRPLQKAELTRISQTLKLVPNVFWVIVEDADEVSDLVKGIRKRSGLFKRSIQLHTETPEDFKLKKKDPHWKKPRGVAQRNTGLEWVRRRILERPSEISIVYFMDDDNTYSEELFKEMSKIEIGRVGVWPVGLVGGLMVEKPRLNEKHEVIGFNAAWRPERQFPMDMAGFAISGQLLLNFPNVKFSYKVKGGYQETEILRQITKVQKLQPLASGCTKVLVWHTRTETPNLIEEEKLIKKKVKGSDAGIEV